MDGINLINPQFDIEFAGAKYAVRKATLDKIILFQTRFAELAKVNDPALESKVAAYCLFLILKDAKPNATEEWVAQNAPTVEMADVVEQFAFTSRQKAEVIRKLSQRNAPDRTQTAGGQSSE